MLISCSSETETLLQSQVWKLWKQVQIQKRHWGVRVHGVVCSILIFADILLTSSFQDEVTATWSTQLKLPITPVTALNQLLTLVWPADKKLLPSECHTVQYVLNNESPPRGVMTPRRLWWLPTDSELLCLTTLKYNTDWSKNQSPWILQKVCASMSYPPSTELAGPTAAEIWQPSRHNKSLLYTVLCHDGLVPEFLETLQQDLRHPSKSPQNASKEKDREAHWVAVPGPA